MKPRRRLVVRGLRRYLLCRPPARGKRPGARAAAGRRAFRWLPVAALLVAVFVAALSGGRSRTLPRDAPGGVPVASLAHYSFDDFANAQR